MSVIKLPGGVLRVPWAATLADGVRVDGTRDVTPDDESYQQWLPFATAEDVEVRDAVADLEILSRWRARRTA